MKAFSTLIAGALFLAAQVVAYDTPTELIINVISKPEGCKNLSKAGDKLSMHYTGTLHKTGAKFDSSVDRGRSFDFTLGIGQVIKGWDQGLVGMCVGEKRKLTIPPNMAYGSRAMGAAIPANSALVFDVELLRINGKDEL
ncbi:peptidyl-prolyl cis-trans isomerase FKBP2-like protein [Gamsiella multidivaricata]|uniref:peptidyl-prolyl cis-trans isomerase FKBP2-like protein n=1 Tax=Gamsiella multidivaricata TaxID=101098 RepID=UPI00222006D5|nr:peptidyl-prolyl cis-trans isomerase FKBP2-like protein [Gamsiella multidivaricata]KAG0364659.1 Peptidyl-prolyl cis-trans isomerase fpr2 [Gamsiella multidivaricata]KAI7828946.1 peptidyl-prolyl cis-trans isomerase FKBP2-like protein [Gamsiella multidivaricata]